MAYTKGMNTDTVRELASQMDNAARELRSADAAIERIVANLGRQWHGPDYTRFQGWWQNEHKARLQRMVDSIEGLARSARYNADDQDKASGTGGGNTGGQPGGGGSAPRGDFGRTMPHPIDGPLPGHGRTREQIIADYDRNWRQWTKDGLLWAGGGPDGPEAWGRYQCTAWMWYRLRELGYDGPRIPQGDLDHPAYEERLFGATTDTVPKTGAVVAYSGHVMMAEEVYVNEQGQRVMRVSEMNSGTDGSGARIATAGEYRDSEVWVEQADGRWRSQSGRVKDFSIANPEFGKPRI